MSTITTRWTRNAILARLAASDAIDNGTTCTLRERAESRIDLLRIAGALDDGRVDAAQAEVEFLALRERLVGLPLSLSA